MLSILHKRPIVLSACQAMMPVEWLTDLEGMSHMSREAGQFVRAGNSKMSKIHLQQGIFLALLPLHAKRHNIRL